MEKLSLKRGIKAAVIVAHPDDEVIWMGGTILKNKQVDWTIFSLCRESDDDRRPKFERVAEHFGAKGVIADLDDEEKISSDEAKKQAKKLIKANLCALKWDIIFTHNTNGEYGHERHKSVHVAATDMFLSGSIDCKEFLCFNYIKNEDNGKIEMRPAQESDYVVELDAATYNEKKRIVAEMYGYAYDGIDVGLCTNPEAFKIISM